MKDKTTCLNYMQARYYGPELGRFLSIDPVGFSVDMPFMFGQYTYASNDPINSWDPFEMAPFDQFDSIDNAAVDLLQYAAQDSARNDEPVKRERGD